MAKPSILGGQFNCSVCLGQLIDPVTIPYGHSYCMSCIKDYWDQADRIGLYRCPLCMQSFTTRPVLSKNIIMGEMIEKLKMIQILAAVPAHFHAGPGDYVECDICTGTKRRSVKSCLVCLESFCQTHFEHHEEFYSGKPNKSHDAVTAVAESIEKQKQLEEAERNYQNIIQFTERNLQMLREDVKFFKHCVETTQLIRDQKSEVSRAEGLSAWETNEPRRTDAKLNKMLRTRDHIRLLQSLQSLSDSGSLLKETLEDFRKERIQNLTGRAPKSLSSTVPKLQPRPFSVALPSTSTVLEPWTGSTSASASLPWSITFSESQPKPLKEPKSQFRTSTAPQISNSRVTI